MPYIYVSALDSSRSLNLCAAMIGDVLVFHWGVFEKSGNNGVIKPTGS